jgi:hypothetical protein
MVGATVLSLIFFTEGTRSAGQSFKDERRG